MSPKTTKIEPTTPNRAHFHATNAYLIIASLDRLNKTVLRFYNPGNLDYNDDMVDAIKYYYLILRR